MEQVDTKYWAGVDWSRRDTQTGSIHVASLVAVESVQALDKVCAEVCVRLGLQLDYVFHAADDKPKTREAFFRAAVELGNAVRVVAVVRDTRGVEVHLKPQKSIEQFLWHTGLETLKVFSQSRRLVDIIYDRDIQGKERQKKFITEAKRLHGEAHPYKKCGVRFCPAADHRVVQLADCVAFNLYRLRSGLIERGEYRDMVEAFVKRNAVVIETMPE